MQIDRRTVSRKTPNDGKLEISRAAADRLAEVEPPIIVEWSGESGPAALSTFDCTCAKADGAHIHHFLESPILRSLPVGEEVDLILRAGAISVALTHSA